MTFAKRHNPAVAHSYVYTAAGAETSVTGADDNGDVLDYDAATVKIFFEGVRLHDTEYTATDGTSVTGIAAMGAGTILRVDTLGDSGNPIQSYNKAASDAKYALTGANSDLTSLAGLTTPLSEAQGGTGSTSLPTSVVGDALVHVYNSAQLNNVWGDNTQQIVIFNTEVADVGGDYATGTGIFTAPATGYYLVSYLLNTVPGTHAGGYVAATSSNRSQYGNYVDTNGIVQGSGIYSLQGSFLVDMDSADTFTLQWLLAGASLDADMASGSWMDIIQLT